MEFLLGDGVIPPMSGTFNLGELSLTQLCFGQYALPWIDLYKIVVFHVHYKLARLTLEVVHYYQYFIVLLPLYFTTSDIALN